jgi:integrase
VRVEQAFAHLERVLGASTPASELTRRRLIKYYDQRHKEEAADATIKYEIACLASAFTVAVVEDEELATQPVFWMPTVHNARQGFFEASDMAALMAELPTPLYRSMAEFTYYLGWRKGEVTGLTWHESPRSTIRSTINWERKVIRILPPLAKQGTKGGDAREIPFGGTPIEAILTERWEQRDGPFVFHRDGEPVQTFFKVWRSACKRAKLGGRLFHDFRRTAYRDLLKAGVPEKVARSIVGRKRPETADRYFIVTGKEQAAALAQRFSSKAASKAEPSEQEAEDVSR